MRAMYLKRVIISNFKNIRTADLAFSPKINCISGNNGEGKTNLLDAIYYLSMTKSYFNSSDSYTFTFGETAAAINGSYVREDKTEDKTEESTEEKVELEEMLPQTGQPWLMVMILSILGTFLLILAGMNGFRG